MSKKVKKVRRKVRCPKCGYSVVLKSRKCPMCPRVGRVAHWFGSK